MKFHTQTNLDPGNCWQTAVACILGVEPEEMPSQVEHDAKRVPQPDGGFKWVGPNYITVLNRYLFTHHGMAYLEIHYPPELWAVLDIRQPGVHLMTGKTVRSATNGARHVVVGQMGTMIWDPHPTRAGLTTDINYAFLIPFPETWKESWKNIPGAMDPCICPRCTKP